MDPIDVFRARCEARALLWHGWAYGDPDDPRSLHTAVDALQQAAALSYGIRTLGGQDAVQAILASVFSVVRQS